MPYKSERQRRFMHAKLPKLAAEWDRETPKGKRLPRKVKQVKRTK